MRSLLNDLFSFFRGLAALEPIPQLHSKVTEKIRSSRSKNEGKSPRGTPVADRDVKSLLFRLKNDPGAITTASLQRLMTFVLTCKFSAYDFFLFLKETSCKSLKKWVKLTHPKLPKNIAKNGSEKTSTMRKMLLQVVNAFLTTAIADYKKEFRPARASVTKTTRSRSRDFRSNRSSQSSNVPMHQHYTNSVPTPMSCTSKLPLAVPPGYNQTPLYSKNSKIEGLGATAGIEGESNNMSFTFGTENSQPYKQLFQKKDLKELISMRGFTEFVALACSAVRDADERREITMLLDTLISTV